MTTADKLRALLGSETDEEMREYYRLCLAQLRPAPRPLPNPPRRCPGGRLDVLAEVER